MNYFLYKTKQALKRFVFTPYWSPLKYANALGLFAQFVIFKNSKIIGYPLKLSLDPSSNCMLHCPLCPTGQGSRLRTRGNLSFENFKKVLDEMSVWLYEVDLNNWGEPFLNKEIVRMVDYAHKKRVKTSINSNLNIPLTEKTVEGLVNAGLDVLYVSFDGITQKTYEKYRRNGKLENVFKNLKLVHEIKKRLDSKKPRVVWQFLVMKHNEHEVPELERVKQELGVDELVIGGVRSDMGKEIYVTDKEKVESTKDWLPENEKYSRYDYEKKSRRLKKKYCHFLWTVSVINWNGSVSPCCSIYDEGEDFGNAFKQGFKKIWNSEKYIAARDTVAGRKPAVKNVCINCIRTGFVD